MNSFIIDKNRFKVNKGNDFGYYLVIYGVYLFRTGALQPILY